MKRVLSELSYAFIAWLIPFVMSVCIFPLRDSQRPLFEIIMSVTLTANTALLGLIYLSRTRGNPLARSVAIGAVWMVANWAIDLLMFSSGPMQMPLRAYVLDIAGAYFVIPVITISLGAAAGFATRGGLSSAGA